MVDISIQRLDAGLPLPSYAHPGDAGADLHSAVDLTLEPGERALVPTGIAMALPEGYVALVHPRSGLAARHGISIVNAPGTIDAGYRGEVKVCLVNTDRHESFAIRRGDRVAQLVIQRFETASFVEAEELPGSARGDGGYGSTGGFTQASAEVTHEATPTSAHPGTPTQTQTPAQIRAGGTTT
jgi:dUTP pyrophosphatase